MEIFQSCKLNYSKALLLFCFENFFSVSKFYLPILSTENKIFYHLDAGDPSNYVREI
jgi:hypothetical protein